MTSSIAPSVIRRDEQTPTAPEYSGVVPGSLANGRRIDNRHNVFKVVAEEFVEQYFVAVLEHRQSDVSTDIISIVENRRKDSFRLRIDIVMLGRQQALDSESASFFVCEARTFVAQRIAQ